MALGFSIRYALLLLVTFSAEIVFSKDSLPEHILCRDEDCNQTISKGRTTQVYNAPSDFHVSFPPNHEVNVYGLSEDKKLLRIEVANKRGYAPASIITITNQFVETHTLKKVKAQFKQNGLDTTSSETPSPVTDAPLETSLPDITATQTPPTGTSERSCIIDSTTMFGALCDDSDATPLGTSPLPSTEQHAPSVTSSLAGKHTPAATLLGQDGSTESIARLFAKAVASTPASFAQHQSAMPHLLKSSDIGAPLPQGGVEPPSPKTEEPVQEASNVVPGVQTMSSAPHSEKLHEDSSSSTKSEVEGQTSKELSEQPKLEEPSVTPLEQKSGTYIKPTEDSEEQVISKHSDQEPDDVDEETVADKPIPGEEEEEDAELEDEDEAISGEELAADIKPSSVGATDQRATEQTEASADVATNITSLPDASLKANLSKTITHDAPQPSSSLDLQDVLQDSLSVNLSETMPQDVSQPSASLDLQGDLQSTDSASVAQQSSTPVSSGLEQASMPVQSAVAASQGVLPENSTLGDTSVLSSLPSSVPSSLETPVDVLDNTSLGSIPPTSQPISLEKGDLGDLPNSPELSTPNAAGFNASGQEVAGSEFGKVDSAPTSQPISLEKGDLGNLPNSPELSMPNATGFSASGQEVAGSEFGKVDSAPTSQPISSEKVDLGNPPNSPELSMPNATGFSALEQEAAGSEFGKMDDASTPNTSSATAVTLASPVSSEAPPQKTAADDAVEQATQASAPISSPDVNSPVEPSSRSEEPLSMSPQKRVLLQQPVRASQVIPPFGLGLASRAVASEPVATPVAEEPASTVVEEILPKSAVVTDDVPLQSTAVSETAVLDAVLSPSATVSQEIPLQSATVEQDVLSQSVNTEEVVSSMLDSKPLVEAPDASTGETWDTSNDQVPAMDLYWNMAREYMFWLSSLVPEPLQAALAGLVLGMAPPAALTIAVTCGVLGCTLLVLRACYLQRRKENALTGTISSLEQKLFTLVTEREVLTEQLEKARSQVEQSRQELSEQEQQAKCLQEEKQELQSCQKDRDQVLRDLRASLAERNEQLNATKLLLVEKEQQVSELESEASWHQQNEASLEEQLRGAKEEVLRLEEISEEAQEREKEAQSRLVEATQTGDRLWKELESLRQREQALCVQVDKSSEEVSRMAEDLAEKDVKIEALLNSMEQLQVLQEHWQSQEEPTSVSSRLKVLMDIAQIQHECKIARDQQSMLQSKLEAQAKELEASRTEADSLRQEMAANRAEQEAALRQRQEAMTKLEVLSSYFKDRELHLQREIGRQEVEHLQKEADVSTAAQRLLLLEQQSASYQSQLASLKREMDLSERNYKTQVADQEKRAHENWLAARAAERKLEEAHKETASLRQRLTLLEREQQMQPGFPPGGPLLDGVPDGLPPMPPLPMGVPLPPPPLGMPPLGGPPLPPLMDMMRPPPFPPEAFKRMRHSPYREGEGLPLPPWASPPPLFEPRPVRGGKMGPPSPGSSDSRSNTYRSSPHSSSSEPRRNGMGNSNV